MLRKILFSNIPVIYFAGAVLGTLVGFFLLMATLNAWNLYQTFIQSQAGDSEQYVTINKEISILNTMSSEMSGFTEKEIEEIKNAGFVDDMAPFLRAEFGVRASREASANMPYMRTEMFFEAVPDRFLDKVPEVWGWEEGQENIPVIIPKDYLNLYNFGFAKAQGLPNVSEALIGQFSFDIKLYGHGRVERFSGSIAGFSNRIQSLLVPIEFLKAANERFTPNEDARPDRLILKLKPNMEKDMYAFLSNKGYETTHDAFQGGKVSLFVHVSGGILLFIAALIILLALIVYALTLQLTVQRNKDEIYQLILLGYKPRLVFLYYFIVQLVLAVVVLFVSGVFIQLLTVQALDFLASRYIELGQFSSIMTYLSAAMVMLLFVAFTGTNTYRLVRKLAIKGTI